MMNLKFVALNVYPAVFIVKPFFFSPLRFCFVFPLLCSTLQQYYLKTCFKKIINTIIVASFAMFLFRWDLLNYTYFQYCVEK